MSDSSDSILALRLRRRDGVECRRLPEKALLLDGRTGGCFELNQVGAEVWSRLDGLRTLEEVCAELQVSLDVPPDRLRSDVGRFGVELETSGLAERLR